MKKHILDHSINEILSLPLGQWMEMPIEATELLVSKLALIQRALESIDAKSE